MLWAMVLILMMLNSSILHAACGAGENAAMTQNCVGCPESDDPIQYYLFQAPGDSDDLSLMDVFTVRDRFMRNEGERHHMVYVPASTLELGDRSAQIKEFYIDQYEVSNAEYERFIRATGQAAPRTWLDGRYEPGKENEPVVGVTYEDAEAYARWAGMRLPTEAEWELAAALAQESEKLSNFKEDDGRITNVGEWTSSHFDREIGETEGTTSFKVVRRGTAEKTGVKIPLIDRAPMHRCDCNDFTGFRCVSDRLPSSQ